MAQRRAESAPPLRKHDPASAFTKTVNMPPAFSMRTKTAFGDAERYRNTGGELSGDMSRKIDSVKKTAPKWSMTARASGIPPPPNQPGPGEYAMPSTLYGSHPTLTCPGRVARTTTNRTTPMAGPGDTPSPLDYQVVQKGKLGRVDQGDAPKYTMRSKLVDPSNKEVRPGVQTYNIGKQSRKGSMSAPSWSMTSRASGIPSPPNQPGPGEYALPSTLYGSHPTLTCAGRVPRSTTERTLPMSGDPTHITPSPQDYKVVLHDKIGRTDQTTAPKFTMRSKLKDPSSKEQRPGVQTYNVGKNSSKGLMTSPSWTMAPRSSGIPPPPKQPGPGEYKLPGTIYGSHPTLGQPPRVAITTVPRSKTPEKDDRPY